MIDPGIEAARIEVERSRAQLLLTAKELQGRLEPGKLTRDAWQSAKDKGADLAEEAVDAVRKRPYAAGGVVAALALFIAREPVMELFGKLAGVMTSDEPKKKTKRRTRNGKAAQLKVQSRQSDPAAAGNRSV